MSEMVYLNGKLLPRAEAAVPVMDYGFLYGYGLFETMRAYGGQVFLLDRHIDRLARSAEKLGINIEGLALRNAVMDTLNANKLADARLRLTLSIGEGSVAPDPSSCRQPTLLVVAAPYQPLAEEVYRRGFRAVTSSIRRNSISPLVKLKTANYLESLLARQEAKEAGVDEAICLNEKGLLAEASMSNVFLVSRGKLRTPGEDCGVLPGITRETVLELARRTSVASVECDIKPAEVFQAQEAFLTNSLMEIVPLTVLDGKPIGSGKPGQMTLNLMTEYKKLVLALTTNGR